MNTMLPRIPNAIRRDVYRRDGYRCALCDSTDGLQIHHVVPRGQGGTNSPHNLITLCWRCHSYAHGRTFDDHYATQEDVVQACVEYVADYYAPDWNPWAKHPLARYNE